MADAAAQGDAAAAAVAVDAPAAEPAAATGAESTDPLATELFNLVGDAVCGKTCPQYDARVDKAFSDMLADAASLGDARLRERIGSGPQPQGERIQTAAGERWLYRACRAHQCNLTTLVALYDPATGRMAGRLVDKCRCIGWARCLPRPWIASASWRRCRSATKTTPRSAPGTDHGKGPAGIPQCAVRLRRRRQPVDHQQVRLRG
ncbi:hypothetical protein V8017_15360 [Stenotrophomonas rhizophila]